MDKKKELRINVFKKEQVVNMAKELIEKFEIEGLEAEEVQVIKFFYNKEQLDDGQEEE